MGVTQLWQILGPVEEHQALSSLKGQTLAVDLSIWVCENQCVKQMQGVVSKPYLRNLFFRISYLTQLGIKLVFVIEGSAPELKWDTMIKRQQSRFPGRQGKQPPQRPAGKQSRRNFNSWLKECCELLEILGIPYIQSKGEAEALCALLNAAGLVDGCLTNDGDAFLYGARTVYRNFTMNTKDPHVEMYNLADIQSKLGIDRGGLIALGLLIGCDFVPKGVPGIGAANAVRLLQSLQGQDVLLRLQSWRTMSERDCVDQAELLARRKAVQVPDFPYIKVIEEFLVAKDRCPSRLPEWKRPVPAKLQEFSLVKLEWPIEYTIEKILPLVTLWDMQDLLLSKNPSIHQHLKPHRIVKTRIRQGDPCFEVEWLKPVTDTVHDGSYYLTIESQDMFSKCYPDMSQAFLSQATEQKKKPKAKKKKKKPDQQVVSPPCLDNLSFQFEKVNLGKVTSKLQESVKDLHPSFTEYDDTALTTKAKQPRHLTLSPNTKKPVSKGDIATESRKAVVFPQSPPQEMPPAITKSSLEEAFIPLSQRVKLRMQHKQGSNKENEDLCRGDRGKTGVEEVNVSAVKTGVGDLSNVSSLLEDIQNLSLKEQGKFRNMLKDKQVVKSTNAFEKSPDMLTFKQTPSFVSKKMKQDFQKMSSPAMDSVCSPMSYMKHQGGLGDSFEIQRSPYYIENPWAKEKAEKNAIDISSPGFFSRPKVIQEPEEVDNRTAAEKLIEKLEFGIGQIGSNSKSNIQFDHMATKGFSKAAKCNPESDKLTVDSLMSILSGEDKPTNTGTPVHKLGNLKTATPGNQSISGLDSSSISQFGDFQIQHSLLNSLCSSLVQALTPKGVKMTKDEYDKLVTTLNVLESDDNECNESNNAFENLAAEDPVCDIDVSEIETASKSFRQLNQKLNQKLLIRPIQIDDEDVMEKLSKSARRKLRRKERKVEQELEMQANLQKNSKQKSKYTSQKQVQKNMADKTNTAGNTANYKNSNSSRKQDKSNRKNENVVDSVFTKKSSERRVEQDLNNSALKKSLCKQSDNSVNISASKNGESKKVVETLVKVQNQDKPNNTNTAVDQINEEIEKTKKKRKKKKKVKKASPILDISGDESILGDTKVGSCAEYLKKALENSQRKVSETNIVKASPFMDFSADETLLDLQEISCKIAGEELDDKLHSKLSRKKKLLKEKVNHGCETSGTNTTEATIVSVKNIIENEDEVPIIGSENSCTCSCGKQDSQVSDEISKSKNPDENVNKVSLENEHFEVKLYEMDSNAVVTKGTTGINDLSLEKNNKMMTENIPNVCEVNNLTEKSEDNVNGQSTLSFTGNGVHDGVNENKYNSKSVGIKALNVGTEVNLEQIDFDNGSKLSDENLDSSITGYPLHNEKVLVDSVDDVHVDFDHSGQEIGFDVEVNDIDLDIGSDMEETVEDKVLKTSVTGRLIANCSGHIEVMVKETVESNGLAGPELDGFSNSYINDNADESDESFHSFKDSCDLNGESNGFTNNIDDAFGGGMNSFTEDEREKTGKSKSNEANIDKGAFGRNMNGSGENSIGNTSAHSAEFNSHLDSGINDLDENVTKQNVETINGSEISNGINGNSEKNVKLNRGGSLTNTTGLENGGASDTGMSGNKCAESMRNCASFVTDRDKIGDNIGDNVFDDNNEGNQVRPGIDSNDIDTNVKVKTEPLENMANGGSKSYIRKYKTMFEDTVGEKYNDAITSDANDVVKTLKIERIEKAGIDSEFDRKINTPLFEDVSAGKYVHLSTCTSSKNKVKDIKVKTEPNDNTVESDSKYYIRKFRHMFEDTNCVQSSNGSSVENIAETSEVKTEFYENGGENKTEIHSENANGIDKLCNRILDGAKPGVAQSPACLADRLKMKLRKTSTRTVLDAFTNGK